MTTPPTPQAIITAAIQAARGPTPAYIVGDERDLLSDLWFACNQDMYVFGKRLLEALAAQPPAVAAIPEGMALVPIEPTDEMVRKAFHLDLSYMPGHEGPDRAAVYRAMLSAVPQPAAGQQDRGEVAPSTALCSLCGLGRHVAAHRPLLSGPNQGEPLDHAFTVDAAAAGEATAAQGAATEKEVASLRDQIKNLERIKNDLSTRLFKALETEPTLTAALREVDHTPGGSLSRALYSDVLDIACVHIARVKELEAAAPSPAAPGNGEGKS